MRSPEWNVLRGRLPVRLIAIFKLQIHAQDVQLAFVERTEPLRNGKADRASGMVQVTLPSAKDESRFTVIPIAHIDSAAHLIPLDPHADFDAKSIWLVNSHIDLETWNEVYDKDLDWAPEDSGENLDDGDESAVSTIADPESDRGEIEEEDVDCEE